MSKTELDTESINKTPIKIDTSVIYKKTIYKVAIEHYFNAYIKADIDNLLDALHPDGPMYPQPAAINQLRSSANENALKGNAVAKDISIIEESIDKVRVKITLFMRVDVNNNGNFQEETAYPTCELRLKNGKWRLFKVEVQ
jgi:hypothetical protein